MNVAGCAHLPAGALGVPAVEQATDYSCGPATLTAVLRYWKRPVACEQDLYQPLHTTPKDGTEPYMLEKVARERGLEAEYRIGASVDDLRRALAAGTTVILDLQAWRDTKRPWSDDWDDGHYVVLVAIDHDTFGFEDPSVAGRRAFLSADELDARWHDEDAGHRHDHTAIFFHSAPSVVPRAMRTLAREHMD